ncbi:MAG: M28 family metallopeptidase [Thermoplasmatota archaeon]
MRPTVALLLLTLPALAGCLQDEPGTSTADGPAIAQGLPAATAEVLVGLSDGSACLADLEEFLDTAPRRFDNLFEHDAARDWLDAYLTEAGFHVTRPTFDGTTHAPAGDPEGVNVIGTLNGTAPGGAGHGAQRPQLIVGAHYDTVPTSVEGAYDDGAGTVLAVCLAPVLAQFAWHHDIVVGLWDQEELGLIGSRVHAEELADRGVPVTLYVNYDMTGINWPAHPGPLNIPLDASMGGEGENELQAAWRAAHDLLEYPPEATSSSTGLTQGPSDHGSFLAAGYPAAWVSGAKIGRNPGYHNADTFENMIVMAGGDRAGLEEAFDTVLEMTAVWLAGVDEQMRAAGEA